MSRFFRRTRVVSALATVITVASLSAGLVQADGAVVDRSFGDRGLTKITGHPTRQDFHSTGLVRAEDGRLLAFGQVNGDIGMFAFEPDGSRSATLRGQHYRLFEPVEGGGADWDMPEQAARHGRGFTMIAGGIDYVSAWESYQHLTLTRIGDDGRLDPRFGEGGTVRFRGLRRAIAAKVDSKLRIITVSVSHGKGGAGKKKRIPSAYTIARFTKDGRLDKGFGRKGMIRRGISWGSTFGGIDLDENDRVLVTGYDNYGQGRNPDRRLHVIRYGADGRLDPTFGDGGYGETSVRIDPMSITSLPGGKTMISGERRSNDGENTFIRYLRSGVLDQSFGQGGVLEQETQWQAPHDLTPVAGGAIAYHVDSGLAMMGQDGTPIEIERAALPARGKGDLLAEADGSVLWLPSLESMPFIGRIGPDRALDASFSGAALPAPSMYSSTGVPLYALGRSGDGALLGAADIGSNKYFSNIGLFRLTASGKRNLGFGSEGFAKIEKHRVSSPVLIGPAGNGSARVIASGPGFKWTGRSSVSREGEISTVKLAGFRRDTANDLLTLPDGRFIVAGMVSKKVKGQRYKQAFARVARFKRNGNPDRSFGQGGKRDLLFMPNGVAQSVTIDRQGRIVVAGGACSNLYFCSGPGKYGQEVTFFRLTAGGDVDRSFGNDGVKRFRHPGSASAGEVTVLGDGSILGGLWIHCTTNCQNRIDLVRLTPGGEFDRSFGGDGRLTIRAGRNLDVAGIFPAGRHGIDLAGSMAPCGKDPAFSVLRLNRRGKLDRGFGGGDGLIRGRSGGFGATGWVAVKQNPLTVTIGGALEARNAHGGAEVATGLQRLKLKARDGRESVKPCRP